MADELPPWEPQLKASDVTPPPPAPPPPAARPRPKILGWLIVLLYVSSLGAAYVASQRKATPTREPGVALLKRKTPKVGWIRIAGPIYEQEGGFVAAGVRGWVREVKRLQERDDVKAIVLEINSPGGSVGAVQELHSHLLRAKSESKKPLVAVMGDVAASGGYYLAAACDKVIAHPGTITGSIGVIFSTLNTEGLFGKLGVQIKPIKSGLHKDIGSPHRPMTEEEKKILQALIDDAYGQFLEAVASGRKMDKEKARALADGRIYTGAQALAVGLVDQLGDTKDALVEAGRLGGIEGEPKVLGHDDPFEELLRMLDTKLQPLGALGALRPLMGPRLEYLWAGL